MELSEARFDNEYDGEDFLLELNGTKLLGQMWKPERSPLFVYVFIHGLGAYITFKKDLFYVILEKGGAVFGCDHLGHGRSEGVRASCTVDEIAEETVKVVALAHERFPGLPIVLHGHSMGGLGVIYTVLTRYAAIKESVSAVIAEAPWISKCPQRELTRIERFGFNVLHKVWPTCQMNAGVTLFTPDLDQNWVKLCEASPYHLHALTPRLYMSVEAAHELVRTNTDQWPADLPFLFLQGEADANVDAKENDKWIRGLMSRVGMTRITYRSYPDVPHMMLKCPKRGEVIRDMLSFIDASIQHS